MRRTKCKTGLRGVLCVRSRLHLQFRSYRAYFLKKNEWYSEYKYHRIEIFMVLVNLTFLKGIQWSFTNAHRINT